MSSYKTLVPVAQRIARPPPKGQVGGSIPPRDAIKINEAQTIIFLRRASSLRFFEYFCYSPFYRINAPPYDIETAFA